MCGRIVQSSQLGTVGISFGIDSTYLSDPGPRYNIAPGSGILAVKADLKLEYLHWGLIPHWAKDKKISYSLINARAETILEKPSFRSAFKSRRCVIPVDGFYEWKSAGKKKQPYFIKQSNSELMFFAGLWEEWKSQEEETIGSCTIITTDANNFMQDLHHRMPAIIPSNELTRWLTNSDQLDVLTLLKPSSLELVITPVSPDVNNAKFQGKECIEPIAL